MDFETAEEVKQLKEKLDKIKNLYDFWKNCVLKNNVVDHSISNGNIELTTLFSYLSQKEFDHIKKFTMDILDLEHKKLLQDLYNIKG